jgi:hypothetical protein
MKVQWAPRVRPHPLVPWRYVIFQTVSHDASELTDAGCEWVDCTRYQIGHRGWLQHSGINCLYVSRGSRSFDDQALTEPAHGEHLSKSRAFLSRKRQNYLQKVCSTILRLCKVLISRSIETCAHGFYHSNRDAPTPKRADIHYYWL